METILSQTNQPYNEKLQNEEKMNHFASSPVHTQSSSYKEFCESPATQRGLQGAAQEFLEKESGKIITNMVLNDRWQNFDRKRKDGYIGREVVLPSGAPSIQLTYNDFRHGGRTCKFNSYEALSKLWAEWQLYHDRPEAKGLEERRKARLERIAVEEKANKEKEQQEEKDKAKNLASDVELWKTLSTKGESAYLRRKGFLSLPEFIAIRYASNFITALVTDLNGNVHGVQKIWNDGTKKFGFGSTKKGSFVQLGELSLDDIFFIVCEGIATGLSIQLAIPEAVVLCALDAGNITTVVKALRQKYGGNAKCPIIIAADDDHWNAEKINPRTGKPIGNTGLLKANKVAMRFNCSVASPKFDLYQDPPLPAEVLSSLPSKPKDFNDLHQIEGLAAVRKQILEYKTHADISFALAGKERVPTTKNGFIFSSRYLNAVMADQNNQKVNLLEAIWSHAVTLLKSPIGTGKTALLNQILKEHPEASVVYVPPLIALAQDGANRLDLELYSNYKDKEDNILKVRRLSICLNSLARLISPVDGLKIFDFVIFDESEQNLRRLTTKIDDKVLIFDTIARLIKSAKHVIFADAHISNISKHVIRTWRPEPYFEIINTYKAATGRKLWLWENDKLLLKHVCDVVSQGKKLYIICDSKRRARQIFKKLKSLGVEILIICADNNNDEAVRRFFDNPNEESKKYYAIVCSPAVISGVSIDNHHFDEVVGFFGGSTIIPTDAVQGLGRPRDVKDVHVYISRRKNFLPTDRKVIASKWLYSDPANHDLLRLSKDGKQEIREEDYRQLYLEVKMQENRGKNDFFENMITLLHDDGFDIKWMADTKEQSVWNEESVAAKELAKEAKELEEKSYIEDRETAKDIAEEEATHIDKKARRTYSETCALEKYKVKDFYCQEHATNEEVKETLKLDQRGKLRECVKNFEIALASTEDLQKLHQEQKNHGNRFVPDQKMFGVLQVLFRYILAVAGFNVEDRTSTGKRYSKRSLAMDGFVDKIETMRLVLQGIWLLPPQEKLQENPIRFIGSVLKKLGLKQKRTGKAQLGEYMLSPEELAFIQELVAKRAKKREEMWHQPLIPELEVNDLLCLT
ncbi:MAG: hypothetical protein HY808_03645 [Nitrospirae bacterium]|nr:hypothetical protein [Nitrospirota bacterium]